MWVSLPDSPAPGLRAFSLSLLLLTGVAEVSAAPISFTFSGTATEARSKPGGGEYRPGVGGGGIGTTFQGVISLTDRVLADEAPGSTRDRFTFRNGVSPSADAPARDLRLRWNFARAAHDTGDLTGFSPTYPFLPYGSLELIDSVEGDIIRFTFRSETNANHRTTHVLSFNLVDPSGTAFASVESLGGESLGNGLTGSYNDALKLLSTVDLSLFTENSGTLNYDSGGHSIYREDIFFELTSLSADADASVPGISLISRRADNGQGGDGTSWDPSVSADGRWVAFSSDATQLVNGDSNGAIRDIYLFDRTTGEMQNLTSGGNGNSEDPTLSKDGRWMAFMTSATNLPTNIPDSNGAIADIVLAEVSTGELTLVTAGANAASRYPSLSRNGRRLVFETQSTNLTSSNYQPFDCNRSNPADPDRRCYTNVVLYDRVSQFSLILTQGGKSDSRAPSISESGTQVAYVSEAFGGRQTPVVAMNLETGERKSVPLHPPVPELALNFSRPIISANARWLAVRSTPTSDTPLSARRASLHLYDLDNDVAHELGSSSVLPGEFSSDERFLVFSSQAIDIDPPDGNGTISDIYRLDLTVAPPVSYERVSAVGNGASGGPGINADGSVIVWDSKASNLAADNNGERYDVFLRDTQPLNRPPVAQPQSLSVAAGGNLNITLSGFDPDGDALQFNVNTEPSHGRLSGSPPNIAYTPSSGYSGVDGFTFTVQDAGNLSEPAQVSISITPSTSMGHTFTATQREDSRTIDLTATWPSNAIWTQVREYEGSAGVLWDGQATTWTDSYTPLPESATVTFNSRYWLPGVIEPHNNIDITVQLRDAGGGGGVNDYDIGGHAWVDANVDSRRDPNEVGDVGRSVSLYRCEAPWGTAATTTALAPDGTFGFRSVSPGKYQIGTDPTGVIFSAVEADNVIHANGFSNCFDFQNTPIELSIGVLGNIAQPTVGGFAWIDSNGDGFAGDNEPVETGRLVNMFRCGPPWGIAGSGVTDASGRFTIANAQAGEYQFGTQRPDGGFSPVGNDNAFFASGFTSCVSVGEGSVSVGMGVLP